MTINHKDHSPTSIEIESEIQDDNLTFDSIAWSLKSSDVTPQKKDKSVLPSGDTTPFQKNPNMQKIIQ